MSPTGPCFAVAPQAMPPLPTRPGVEPEMLRARAGNTHWSPNPGPPKPHVRAGRAPEPRPKPGHSAAGSPPRARASPGARCPGSPRSPQRGPTTARDSPPPGSPGRSARASPCALLSRAPGPEAPGPPPLTASWPRWPGREMPAAGEREREDERARARRRRQQRQSGRLSRRPELRLLPLRAGGASQQSRGATSAGAP